MLSRWLMGVCLALSLTAAWPLRAEAWNDPDLGQALEDCELVVRARAPAEGARGERTVSFSVLSLLKGRTLEDTIEVGGFGDPSGEGAPVFRPNEEVYLILVRRKDRLEVPSPTFGRFPVRDGLVRRAALRDTFLRLDLDPADFEAFMALRLGRLDALPTSWLDDLRGALRRGEPSGGQDGLDRLILALECLALAGKAEDAGAILRYLDPRWPFQLRISACRALARATGSRGAARLLEVAREDPEPAVRTGALRVLAALEPQRELVEGLAALLPDATAEPVRLGAPDDPRGNAWPSPKEAALHAIERLGPAGARAALLAVLEEPSPTPEVFAAALRALMSLEADLELAYDLAARLRADGEPGADRYNHGLCSALGRLTGKPLGNDPAKWQRWAEARQ